MCRYIFCLFLYQCLLPSSHTIPLFRLLLMLFSMHCLSKQLLIIYVDLINKIVYDNYIYTCYCICTIDMKILRVSISIVLWSTAPKFIPKINGRISCIPPYENLFDVLVLNMMFCLWLLIKPCILLP